MLNAYAGARRQGVESEAVALIAFNTNAFVHMELENGLVPMTAEELQSVRRKDTAVARSVLAVERAG